MLSLNNKGLKYGFCSLLNNHMMRMVEFFEDFQMIDERFRCGVSLQKIISCRIAIGKI